MSGAPHIHDSAERLAERIIETLDGRIVLALPLGLGKAVRVANALYARAEADRAISLDIFTALTLEPPGWSSDLERRFVEPLNRRLYAGYTGLAYAGPRRADRLPDNVRVSEFFLLAGRLLGAREAQQDYVSANYTHAARYVLARGINVIAQLVARRGPGAAARYSLSCNTDITLDILPALRARSAPFLMVGEVSDALPYMPGPAELEADAFDHVLDGEGRDDPLFVVPRQPVSAADHAVGLHAASLVKDGGTLQIGIGSLGDAFAAGLVLRQRAPERFAAALDRLTPERDGPPAETGRFETGLYGASEMLVDGFMELYREGILTRPAADGALLHAGFFVGCAAFYRFLRELSDAERARFQMRAISFVNALYGEEAAKRADRRDARFVNNAMMVTLLGATVSDGLEDGRVVSGVGGQYNFVSQAFALDDARSLITLNATRRKNGRDRSRIVWSYGHETIPRHLRDIVVTEYGIADLRGRSDRECIAALLNVTDSAFQDELLDQAKKAGKIERDYRIPAAFRDNRPARVAAALAPLRQEGWCRPFPFDTEFTPVEQRLLPALGRLRDVAASRPRLARAALAALWQDAADGAEREALERMDLASPAGWRERLYARLLLAMLRETG